MKCLRPILWLTLATLAALAILLALGTWQLLRKIEKEQILAALERSITQTPIRLENADLAALRVWPTGFRIDTPGGLRELTRVTIRGSFIPARSIPVRATLPAPRNARALGGLGFFWMTPLQIENGPVIFINRGFVPVGADYKAPAVETPEGPQTITGLLRVPEKAQTFTPTDNPAKGEYFIREPKVMAAAVSLKEVADFFIDAERTGRDGLTPPVGIDAREMIARIPNNHLQYAVTWYGFAIVLVVIFGFFARTRLKQAARTPA